MKWFCRHHFHPTGAEGTQPAKYQPCAEETQLETWEEGKCCFCGKIKWRIKLTGYEGIGG